MGSVPSGTLNVVLVAVGCLLAVDTANEVVAATRVAPAPERSAALPPSPAARERSWADRQVILDRNLFSSRTLAPVPAVQQENIEKSRLPVTLLGTFAADEPSLSRATLHHRESEETLVVGIGDEVEDQALVVQIERRRVVLRDNGVLRELILDEVESGASRVTRLSRSAQSSPLAPARTEEPLPRLDPNVFAPSESEHAFFNQLLGQGRVLPKFEHSEVVGLEVSGIQAGSIFDEIGLENGDVITEFNGTPVDSQAQFAKVLQQMSDADEYHLVGRRADGSERVWDFVRAD